MDNVLVQFDQSGGAPVIATMDSIIARLERVEALTGNPAATELRVGTEAARAEIAALEESFAALRDDEAVISETEINVQIGAAEAALSELEGLAVRVREQIETPIVIPPIEIPPVPPSALPTELSEIEAAAVRAEARMEQFGVAAVEGTSRIKKPAEQAQLAINDLRKAIESARAAGSPVPPGAEAQLAALNAQYAVNITRAGEVKANQRAVADSFKIAEVAAGETRGQFTSLNDLVRVMSPEFGKLANQISGSFVAVLIAVQAIEALGTVYKKTGEVIDKFVISGQQLEDVQIRQAQASDKLKRAHAEEITEMDDVWGMHEEFYRGSIEKQREMIDSQVSSLKRFISEEEKSGRTTADTALLIEETAKKQIEWIDEVLGHQSYRNEAERKYLEDTKKSLTEVIDRYAKVATGAKQTTEETKKLVSEFQKLHDSTIGNVDALAIQGKALENLFFSLTKGGNISAQTAQALISDAEKIKAEYEKLGIAIPMSLLGVIKQIEARAHDLNSALRSMGIAQSGAIKQSIEDLEAYGKEIEKGGKLTEEAAQKIATAAAQIIKQLNELPESQRKGAEATIAYLKGIEEEYNTLAIIAKQKLAIENTAAINSNVAAIHALVDEFGKLSTVTHAQAEKVITDAKKILAEIELLPKAQQKAYKETIFYLQELIAAYQTQAEKTKNYAEQGAAGIEAATKKALEYYQKQIDKSHELVVQSQKDTLALIATLKQRAAGLTQQTDPRAVRLDELRQKPSLTVDELNEQSKLTQELQKQSAAANSAAKSQTDLAIANSKVSASSEEISKTVEAYRTNIAAAQKDGLKLEEAQKQAIENYLTRLQQLGDSGKATAENIKGTLGAVDAVLNEAKNNAQIAAEAAKTRTDLILAQSKKMVDASQKASTDVAKASDSQATAVQNSADKMTAANQQTVDSTGKVTVTYDENGKAVITNAQKVDQLKQSTEGAKKSTDDLAAATTAATDAAKTAETKAVDQKQKTDDLKTATDSLKGSEEGLRTTSDILSASLDGVAKSATPLEVVLKAIAELHLEKTFQPIIDLINEAGGLSELTNALSKFVEDMGKLDTKTLAKKVDEIAQSFNKLAKAEENAGKVAAARIKIMEQEVIVATQLRDVLRDINASAT